MKRMLGFIALIAVATAGFVSSDAAAKLHFGLSSSAPEADASVASIEEVRLWFTQVPQDNSVGIRLIDSAGEAVGTGEASRDAEDGKVFSLALDSELASGAYTVAWRGIGDDGHVVRGDFGFSVATH
jgi:methionine-rich copper-binding protein CopC